MITAVRRHVLWNLREGNHPYDGFYGSELGGAIRSVQLWREGPRYITVDARGCLMLTPAGIAAVQGETN